MIFDWQQTTALPQAVWLSALLLLTCPGLAQNPFNYCEVLTEENGLPSNRIQCITEDDLGFWWIGTDAGLVQYDGAHFNVYTHSEEENSLVDDRVYDLLHEGDHLWIATHYGISRLDLISGHFRNYRWTYDCKGVSDSSSLEESAYEMHLGVDGTVWAGTHHCGFLQYQTGADTFVIHRVDTAQLDILGTGTYASANKMASWYITSFENDNTNDSILWVGSGGGLIRHNIVTGKSECLIRFREESGRENQIYGYSNLFQFDDGLMILGSTGKALITFDPTSQAYGTMTAEDPYINGIFGSNPIHFYTWNDSTMWITTWHGVAIYDPAKKRFREAYYNDSDNRKYFGANFVDRHGRAVKLSIWGMYVYDPIQQQFESSSLKHLNEGYHGYIYSVTHDTLTNRYYACARSARGLYYMDLRSGQWHLVNFPARLEENDHISLTDMSSLSTGEYLITTTTDVVRYDPRTHAITGPVVSLDLTVDKLQDVFVDSRDIAWISSREDGVFQYNTRTGDLRNYRFPQQTLTVAAFDTETFTEDSRGRVWMKRRTGYSIYFPDLDSIAHFYPEGLHGSYGGTFAEDDRGNMWIASLPGWLGRIPMDSVQNGIVQRVKVPGASKGNTLKDLCKGPEGYFWCALKEHLVKMDMDKGEHEVFSYNYGVDPNEFFSFQFMHDGRMVFGKRSEIVMADPRTLHRNSELPGPYITDLYLGPESYDRDSVAVRLNRLDFKPHENNFSIGFSTIGMSFGSDNTIWYRLAPLQNEWIQARNSRVANYTNVPGGQYRFQLKAANNEGIENPEVFSMPVSVGTVWYETVVARVFFTLALLTLFYLLYRNRVAQIRKEERMHTEFERRLGEVQMTALQAQMNPHFIFNCLNSIENFIIKNDTYRASTYLNDFARLIRLILQNSRSKFISLEDEMEALALYLQMENLRFTNRFEYEISVSPEVDAANIEIPPMLIQPYVENAIWHGLMHRDTPGKLLIELSRNNGALKCVIEDDGVGRQRSLEINAHKRVKKKRSVGMSITRDRIEMLNDLYDTDTSITVHDLVDAHGYAAGTRVELNIKI